MTVIVCYKNKVYEPEVPTNTTEKEIGNSKLRDSLILEIFMSGKGRRLPVLSSVQ